MDRIEITELSIPELKLYTELNEPQLLHYYEPKGGIFIAESAAVIERALDAGCEPVSFLIERKMEEGNEGLFNRWEGIPVYVGELSVLRKLTGYTVTRGMLCAMKRPQPRDAGEICENAGRIVVLEDITNPTNVGAIFRSAAALGMDAVLLTPRCSDPLYRRAVRVSVGTVFQIPWAYIKEDCPGFLKGHGFETAAAALTPDAISPDAPVLKSADRLAIFFGSESTGLRQDTIDKCDHIVRIPMNRNVDSLNVAAASAVMFWELSKDRIKEGHPL